MLGALLFSGAACQSVPQLPVSGQWHGQALQTTVDSALAQDYLRAFHAPGGERLQPPFALARQQVQAAAAQSSAKLREALLALAQQQSVDVAALLAADYWLGQACHRRITQDLARRQQAEQRAGTAQPVQALPGAAGFVLLLIPGWDYEANGAQTGADFALQRRVVTQYGLENHLVALPPTGGVQGNAQVVAQAVRAHSQGGKALLLVGASSGGPAIHLALAQLLSAQERAPVKAWLNLGGILQGSPLVEYLPRWVLRLVAWYHGWDAQAIFSMGTLASRERFERLQQQVDLLREMVVINYLGIPLSGQISRLAEQGYGPLRAHGPSDGLALLPDMLLPGAPTIVALGSDHFFGQNPQIEAKSLAMMGLLLDAVQRQGVLRCD